MTDHIACSAGHFHRAVQHFSCAEKSDLSIWHEIHSDASDTYVCQMQENVIDDDPHAEPFYWISPERYIIGM